MSSYKRLIEYNPTRYNTWQQSIKMTASCGPRPSNEEILLLESPILFGYNMCYLRNKTWLLPKQELLWSKNMCYLRNKTWLLPKQELLWSKHINCCTRLSETIILLFQIIYSNMLMFQVSWRWDSSSSSCIFMYV
jgi:hypothetical protein